MFLYSKTAKAFLDAWPGKRQFGIYRFMPLFFLLGAALEFSMINWNVGEVNFSGVTWTTYVKHFSVAMIFMMAGAQTVHLVYRPLEDLDEIIEKKKKRPNINQTSK